MSFKIVPICGRLAVYINGEFHCSVDSMSKAEKEINKYKY